MSPQICKISRFRVNNLLKDNEKEENSTFTRGDFYEPANLQDFQVSSE